MEQVRVGANQPWLPLQCHFCMSSRHKTSERSDVASDLFRSRLLDWYDAQARDLPWRARPRAKKKIDPYRVWVSEIMLQQTRVAAVIEHYHEFLRRFPTVQKLAAAREASVLAAWSGLGYYRRARMMHAAAKKIARELGGKFPATAAGWRELPGIGRYTAAAIASIAFDEPVAVVDGNVERVLQRVSGLRLAGETLWEQAEALLDRERPGDFNQAVMELGATVCTPRSPACLTCPVVDHCATRGEMTLLAKPPRQQKREIHYAFYHDCDRVLLVQRRKDASLMAGMWELPEISRPEGHHDPILTLRHSITVTDYAVYVWQSLGVAPSFSRSLREDGQNHGRGKWVGLDTVPQLPLTGLAKKILRKAGMLPTISK